jgi:hypothetical protein
MSIGGAATQTSTSSLRRRRVWPTIGRIIALALLWLVVLLLNLWAVAALYIDCRIEALRLPLAVLYTAAVIFTAIKVKRGKMLACLGCFCLVLVW